MFYFYMLVYYSMPCPQKENKNKRGYPNAYSPKPYWSHWRSLSNLSAKSKDWYGFVIIPGFGDMNKYAQLYIYIRVNILCLYSVLDFHPNGAKTSEYWKLSFDLTAINWWKVTPFLSSKCRSSPCFFWLIAWSLRTQQPMLQSKIQRTVLTWPRSKLCLKAGGFMFTYSRHIPEVN